MESLKLSIMNRTHRRLLVKVWPNCNREPRILEISVLPEGPPSSGRDPPKTNRVPQRAEPKR